MTCIYIYIGEVSQYEYKAFLKPGTQIPFPPETTKSISQTNLRRQDVDLQVVVMYWLHKKPWFHQPTDSDSSSFFPTKPEGNQRDFTTPREDLQQLQQVTGQSCSAPSGILYTNRKSKLPDFRGVIWTLDDVVTRQSNAIYQARC